MQNNKSHILIVDDDERILRLLQKFLQQNSFFVSTALSVSEAEVLLQTFSFDLILLDIMLPETTGLEFAKYIRAQIPYVPIVMLTALSDPEDKIKGLETANDYVTKPFEPRELLMRINNLINSFKNYHDYSSTNKNPRYFGKITYDLQTRSLLKNSNPIMLTPIEHAVLRLLIESNGETISREEIMEKVNSLTSVRSVDVLIVRIRSKIEDDPKNPQYLKTIRGVGYAFSY